MDEKRLAWLIGGNEPEGGFGGFEVGHGLGVISDFFSLAVFIESEVVAVTKLSGTEEQVAGEAGEGSGLGHDGDGQIDPLYGQWFGQAVVE